MNIEKVKPLVERLKNEFGVVLPECNQSDLILFKDGDFRVIDYHGEIPWVYDFEDIEFNLGTLERWMEFIVETYQRHRMVHIINHKTNWEAFIEADNNVFYGHEASNPTVTLLTAFIKYLEGEKK